MNPNENVGYDVNWVRNGSSKTNSEQIKNEQIEKNEIKTTDLEIKDEGATEPTETKDEAHMQSMRLDNKRIQVRFK